MTSDNDQSDIGCNYGSSSMNRDEVREKSAFEEADVEPENYDRRHSSEGQDYIYEEVIQAPKSHESHTFGKNAQRTTAAAGVEEEKKEPSRMPIDPSSKLR